MSEGFVLDAEVSLLSLLERESSLGGQASRGELGQGGQAAPRMEAWMPARGVRARVPALLLGSALGFPGGWGRSPQSIFKSVFALVSVRSPGSWRPAQGLPSLVCGFPSLSLPGVGVVANYMKRGKSMAGVCV